MKNDDDNQLDRIAFACVTRTLDAQELAWVNEAGATNQALQLRIAYWEANVASLDLAVTKVAPPKELWQKIKSSISKDNLAIQKTSKSDQNWWASTATAASVLLLCSFLYWQTPKPPVIVNLGGQWHLELDQNQLSIETGLTMTIPPGMVCNLWFKTGTQVVGVTQLPMKGSIDLDLDTHPKLLDLMQQDGIMMVTVDPANAGLETMQTKAFITANWP